MDGKIVKDTFDYISEAIGFSIDKFIEDADKPGPKSINLGTYGMEKGLVKAHNYMQAGKPWFAMHIMRGVLSELLETIKSQDAEWLVENIDALSDCARNVKSANAAYDEWINTDFRDFLDTFKANKIFSDDELTPEKLTPDFFIELDDSIADDLLKSFKYFDGPEPAVSLADKHFKLTDKLYITDSLQEFMDHLKRFDKGDDVVYVNFLLKIEEREDMSYFVLSFSHKGHSWIVTDMGFDFDNPRNKATTRNPRRRREKYYDSVGFPYGFIDELDAIRKKSKQLAKFDDKNSVELHIKDIKDLPAYNKMFLVATISHFMLTLANASERLLTFEDHINQKFLPGATVEIDESDATGFVGWEDHVREVAEEAIAEVRKDAGTALVKVSSDLITTHSTYDRNWLGTPAQLDNIIKWTVLDTSANALQKELNKLERHKDKDFEKLNEMLNAPGNFERLIPMLFSARVRTYYMLNDGLANEREDGGGFDQVKSKRAYCMKYTSGKRWFAKLRLGVDQIEFKKRCDTWQNASYSWRREHNHDDYLFKPKCQCCGKFKVTKQFYLDINHHEQLVFLCGLKSRDELPKYFRAYRSSELIPYHGNSILSNVHPHALLKHPSWEYSSGLCIEIYTCGNCARKLYNKHAIADVTIVEDFEVKPYDDTDKRSLSKIFC